MNKNSLKTDDNIKDYNKLSIKEAIKRIKEENSDFDKSSDEFEDTDVKIQAG